MTTYEDFDVPVDTPESRSVGEQDRQFLSEFPAREHDAVTSVAGYAKALRELHDGLMRLYEENDCGASITLGDALASLFPERQQSRALIARHDALNATER